MAIEYRSTDKVSKAQKARTGEGSLFNPSSSSAPLPNRRPVSGVYSKPPLPSNEEMREAERQWRGEEQPPVEKYAGLQRHWKVMADDERMQKAEGVLGKITERKDTGDGLVAGYDSGGSVWLRKGSELAGTGIEVLETQHREQHPGLTP